MCRKGKFNFIYKVLTVIVAAGSLLLLPFTLICTGFTLRRPGPNRDEPLPA